MWKKAFIRLALVAIVIAGGMLVLAASHTGKTLKNQCASTGENCDENKAQGEFIIWESLSRSIMTNVQK